MPTNNHNYSMPARGAEDWDADWYTNFNALDEDVVLRGPAADRTTYTSYTDTLYIATDTEEVYRGQGDGVGWEQLESFGENPALGVVGAEEVHAGREVSHSYGVRVISPDVADLGAAINSAIADLAPSGGKIQLPKGRIPMSTQVDFTAGVNGQTDHTPIILEGHGGGRNAGQSLGTQIDASSMTSHGFYLGGTSTRMGVQLRDFTIEMGDVTLDAIHLGEGSGSARKLSIRNVTATGNARYGFWISQAFGSSFENLHAWNIEQGFYFDKINVSRIDSIVARGCNHTTGAAVVIHESMGYTASDIYAESNFGRGIAITAATASAWGAATISGVYTENNNRSGQADHDIYVNQENLLVTGFIVGTPGAAYSGHQMRIQGRNNSCIGGWVNQGFTSWRGNNIMQNVKAVELHSASRTPNVWMGCNASQTDNRNTSDYLFVDYSTDAMNRLPIVNLTDSAGEGAAVLGEIRWHDGTDGTSVNDSEPAAYNGTDWVGLLSGNVIN